MGEEKRKDAIKKYLSENGIKPNSRGYKPLFYAILEASNYPDRSCNELFDNVAEILSKEGVRAVTSKSIYRNAYYAIKHSKNGSYEGGPYDFIKSCSIELESM